MHRDFAQIAIWQAGKVTQAGTFATTPEGVREFAAGLGPHDEVALEATGNTWAIATVLASRAGRVVVSNPVKTRAIAEAKVKTDKGRRGDPGAAARGGFPPPGVDARRRDQRAAPPGTAPRSHRAAADPAEEPGAGDPGPKPGAPLPGF